MQTARDTRRVYEMLSDWTGTILQKHYSLCNMAGISCILFFLQCTRIRTTLSCQQNVCMNYIRGIMRGGPLFITIQNNRKKYSLLNMAEMEKKLPAQMQSIRL